MSKITGIIDKITYNEQDISVYEEVKKYGYQIETEYVTDDEGNTTQVLNISDYKDSELKVEYYDLPAVFFPEGFNKDVYDNRSFNVYPFVCKNGDVLLSTTLSVNINPRTGLWVLNSDTKEYTQLTQSYQAFLDFTETEESVLITTPRNGIMYEYILSTRELKEINVAEICHTSAGAVSVVPTSNPSKVLVTSNNQAGGTTPYTYTAILYNTNTHDYKLFTSKGRLQQLNNHLTVETKTYVSGNYSELWMYDDTDESFIQLTGTQDIIDSGITLTTLNALPLKIIDRHILYGISNNTGLFRVNIDTNAVQYLYNLTGDLSGPSFGSAPEVYFIELDNNEYLIIGYNRQVQMGIYYYKHNEGTVSLIPVDTTEITGSLQVPSTAHWVINNQLVFNPGSSDKTKTGLWRFIPGSTIVERFSTEGYNINNGVIFGNKLILTTQGQNSVSGVIVYDSITGTLSKLLENVTEANSSNITALTVVNDKLLIKFNRTGTIYVYNLDLELINTYSTNTISGADRFIVYDTYYCLYYNTSYVPTLLFDSRTDTFNVVPSSFNANGIAGTYNHYDLDDEILFCRVSGNTNNTAIFSFSKKTKFITQIPILRETGGYTDLTIINNKLHLYDSSTTDFYRHFYNYTDKCATAIRGFGVYKNYAYSLYEIYNVNTNESVTLKWSTSQLDTNFKITHDTFMICTGSMVTTTVSSSSASFVRKSLVNYNFKNYDNKKLVIVRLK